MEEAGEKKEEWEQPDADAAVHGGVMVPLQPQVEEEHCVAEITAEVNAIVATHEASGADWKSSLLSSLEKKGEEMEDKEEEGEGQEEWEQPDADTAVHGGVMVPLQPQVEGEHRMAEATRGAEIGAEVDAAVDARESSGTDWRSSLLSSLENKDEKMEEDGEGEMEEVEEMEEEKEGEDMEEEGEEEKEEKGEGEEMEEEEEGEEQEEWEQSDADAPVHSGVMVPLQPQVEEEHRVAEEQLVVVHADATAIANPQEVMDYHIANVQHVAKRRACLTSGFVCLYDTDDDANDKPTVKRLRGSHNGKASASGTAPVIYNLSSDEEA